MFYWTDKEKTTTAEEATEAIADFLSSSEGIRQASRGDLSEVEDFASKWGVPFNRGLVSKMIKLQGKKRFGGDSALLEEKDEEELFEDFRRENLERIKEEYGEEMDSVSSVDLETNHPELYDWFMDWKSDLLYAGHIWQSSSDLC